MPPLFALGVAPALAAVQHELRAGECIRAFLDDVYVSCQPDRVVPLHARLEHHLFTSTHLRLNAAPGDASAFRQPGAPLLSSPGNER